MEKSNIKLRESIRILERRLGLLKESNCNYCSITLAQCHALVEIGRRQPLMLKELAQILALDVSTMSKTVDALVKKNLVQRKQSNIDRRRVELSLTEEGHTKFQRIELDMNEIFDQVLEKIPEDKRTLVLQALSILNEALE